MESDFGSGGDQAASATTSGSKGGLLSGGILGGFLSGGSGPGPVPETGGQGALQDLLGQLASPLGLAPQANSRFQRLQQFALGRGGGGAAGALQPFDSGQGGQIAEIVKLLRP